jgi:hypothetical protein
MQFFSAGAAHQSAAAVAASNATGRHLIQSRVRPARSRLRHLSNPQDDIRQRQVSVIHTTVSERRSASAQLCG